MDNVLLAILLATLAGLSTGIGSVIAFFFYRHTRQYLSLMLGFSAGVMIYISFAELLTTAVQQSGLLTANLAFFFGIAFTAVLDIFVPHEYKAERINRTDKTTPIGPGLHRRHRYHAPDEQQRSLLMRAGTLTAVGIAIHNLPEGLIVFSSAVSGGVTGGLLVAIAVGLHNIPEGISVFVPIFEATGNRRRAFLYSILAGVVEPVGALLGYAILRPFLTTAVLSGLLAFAAGIMVYISLDELLPAAHKYGQAHQAIIGMVLGMLVMAVSLIILS